MAGYSYGRGLVRPALRLGASALALTLASAAWAQATENQTQTQPTAPEQAASPEAKSAAPADSQEIVVTAQFRAQRLQDTPLAITAVNSAMLEARSQNNLAQVADQAPNVQLKPAGASFGPSITASIRGVGQADFNPAYEPGVGIYVDDVYYPQLTGAVFDLLDLDRVEILRGPQGTLAGRNAEGGAIKLYSKKPTGSGTGYVEATYGTRDNIGLRASADFKVANGLYARLSGVFKQQDGFVDRLDYGCVNPVGSALNPAPGIARTRPAGKCRISKLGGVGYQAVRGILRYAPSETFEYQVIGDYTRDERTLAGEVLLNADLNNPNTNPAAGIPYDSRFICGKFCNYTTTGQPAGVFTGIAVPPGGQPLVATSGNDRSLYHGWGVSGQGQLKLSDDISIDSITGYRSFTAKWSPDDDLSPANIGFGINDLTNWSFSQELRLNARLGDTINATGGLYYFKQSSTYASTQDLRYVAATIPGLGTVGVFPLQFYQPDVTKAGAKAAFGNVAWEIVPGLNINAGLRYTDEYKRYQYFRLNTDGLTVNPYLDGIGAAYGPGYSGPDTRDTDGDGNRTEIVTALTGSRARYQKSRVDWRVAVDYRFSEELLAYGSVSTGFKGGGTNPRPFNAGQVRSFDPEQLTAYELGFKSDLFDRKMRLNVAAFYNRYKDIQIGLLACPDSPCASPANAGSGKIKGAEAELFLRPADGLTIDGSVSYLDFKYTSINPAAGGPTNPAGAQLTDPNGAPKWKWSAGIQYELPVSGIGTLTPRFDAAFQDKLYTGPSTVAGVRTLTFIPKYTVANARLTYRNEDKDLEISFAVTNLFDKYYFLNVFDLRGAGAGLKKGQPGQPRQWMLVARKNF